MNRFNLLLCSTIACSTLLCAQSDISESNWSAIDSAFFHYDNGNYGHSIPFFKSAFGNLRNTEHWDSITQVAVKYADAISNQVDYQGAIAVLDSTFQLISEQDGQSKNKIRLLNPMALNNRFLGEFNVAIELLNESLNLCKISGNAVLGNRVKAHEYLAVSYLDIAEFDSVRYHIQVAESISKEAFIDDPKKMGYFLNNAGLITGGLGDRQKAGTYYLRALKQLEQVLDKDHPSIGIISNNIGTYYREERDFTKAIYYATKARDIAVKTADQFSELQSTYNLATYHIIVSDYTKGLPLLEQAREICRNVLGDDHIFMTNIRDASSEVLLQQHEFEKAIKEAKKSLEIKLRYYGDGNGDVAQSYFTVANALQRGGLPGQALPMAKKSLQIRTQLFGSESSVVGDCEYQLGEIYQLLGQYAKSSANLFRSITILEEYENRSNDILEAYMRLGDVAKAQLNIRSSIKLYQRGLQAVVPHRDLEGHMVPTLEDLDNYTPNLHLVLQGMLNAHFSIYQDDTNKYVAHLDTALRYGELGMAFFDKEIRTTNETSNFIWANYTISFYTDLCKIVHHAFQRYREQKYLDQAWRVISQVKYQALRKGLQHRYAKQFAGLPDSILRHEAEMVQELGALEKYSEDLDSTERLNWSKRQVLYQDFISNLEESYPKYFELKYQNTLPNLQEIQDQLSDSTQILQYFIGDDLFYVLSVSKGRVSFEGRDLVGINCEGWIDSLMVGMQNQNCQLFQNYSHKLAERFLSPFKLLGMRDFVIIPHGQLYRVNFEYLVMEPPNKKDCLFRELEYAIKKDNFRYIYLPEEIFDNESIDFSAKILAIAPGFEPSVKERYLQSTTDSNVIIDSNYLKATRLPWAVKTAEYLDEEMEAFPLINENATEENVKSSVGSYGILHFGTHAEVDDHDPLQSHLVLNKSSNLEEDGYLYAHEIYGMSLQADLISLTACETGLGKFQTGEGLLSMARAFRYAGCPSIAMSLWKIDDQSSAEIIEQFYGNLKGGMMKDRGLREAKLSYLASHPAEQTNPIYWGGMVLIGNVAPIQISNGSVMPKTALFVLLFCLLLIIIVLIMRKKYSSYVE